MKQQFIYGPFLIDVKGMKILCGYSSTLAWVYLWSLLVCVKEKTLGGV